ERLRLQALRAQIPEHRRGGRIVRSAVGNATESRIENRLAVPLDQRDRAAGPEVTRCTKPHAVNADRQIAIFGVTESRMMAGCAGHVLAAAQDGIPEQNPAQRHLVLRGRVPRGRFRRRRQRGEPQVVQRDILWTDIGRKHQESAKREHADTAEDYLPHHSIYGAGGLFTYFSFSLTLTFHLLFPFSTFKIFQFETPCLSSPSPVCTSRRGGSFRNSCFMRSRARSRRGGRRDF